MATRTPDLYRVKVAGTLSGGGSQANSLKSCESIWAVIGQWSANWAVMGSEKNRGVMDRRKNFVDDGAARFPRAKYGQRAFWPGIEPTMSGIQSPDGPFPGAWPPCTPVLQTCSQTVMFRLHTLRAKTVILLRRIHSVSHHGQGRAKRGHFSHGSHSMSPEKYTLHLQIHHQIEPMPPTLQPRPRKILKLRLTWFDSHVQCR